MNNELEIKIRNHLIESLKKSNVSENKIIQRLNLSKNTLFNWKKKIPESIVNYFEISTIIGKSFDDFIKTESTESTESTEPKEKSEIVELIESLDSETQWEIKGIIKNYLFNVKSKDGGKGKKSAI